MVILVDFMCVVLCLVDIVVVVIVGLLEGDYLVNINLVWFVLVVIMWVEVGLCLLVLINDFEVVVYVILYV